VSHRDGVIQLTDGAGNVCRGNFANARRSPVVCSSEETEKTPARRTREDWIKRRARVELSKGQRARSGPTSAHMERSNPRASPGNEASAAFLIVALRRRRNPVSVVYPLAG